MLSERPPDSPKPLPFSSLPPELTLSRLSGSS
jgi:hypothetical protein